MKTSHSPLFSITSKLLYLMAAGLLGTTPLGSWKKCAQSTKVRPLQGRRGIRFSAILPPRSILTIGVLMHGIFSLPAQDLSRYKKACEYLAESAEVREQLSWVFSGFEDSEKMIKRHTRCGKVGFQVSSAIIPNVYVKRDFSDCDIAVPQVVRDEIFFDRTYKSADYLPGLSTRKRANIYLYLAKPVGDFLTCRLVASAYPKDDRVDINLAFGAQMPILLEFDEQGKIKSMCYIQFWAL